MSGTVANNLTSTITLNDGVTMPLFGFGTSKSLNPDIFQHTIEQGYRLVDTAQWYQTEKHVGIAVRKSGVPREKLFVVSKVYWGAHGFNECTKAVKDSLKRLNMKYVDLFLIHTPAGGRILETYDALLKLKEEGLIRSVGVSNFGVHHLEGLRLSGRPLPSVNQIELHVHLHQQEIVDYCQKNNITVMGYSPLAKWQAANDTYLLEMAQRYGKTLAQLMIRWSVQKGYITIPKASSPDRVAENIDVFNWSIDDEDMASIAGLEQMIVAWHPVTCKWKP